MLEFDAKLEQKLFIVLPMKAEWLSVTMVLGAPKRQLMSNASFSTAYFASVEGAGKITIKPENKSLNISKNWQPLMIGLIGPQWSKAM